MLRSPSWHSSVDWAWACEPKCHQFDSQLGYMSGLWTRTLGGVCERQPHIDVSLSLSLSLPFSLKLKKISNWWIIICMWKTFQINMLSSQFICIFYLWIFNLLAICGKYVNNLCLFNWSLKNHFESFNLKTSVFNNSLIYY